MKKIILSADSTCDLNDELKQKYNISIIPLHVSLNNKDYHDMIDINPDMIYENYEINKTLPITAAPNINEYIEHFSKWNQDEYEIIHFTIGSSLSSSWQNAVIVQKEFKNLHVIDSKNLSVGIGIQILLAAKLREENKSAQEIVKTILELQDRVSTTFVVDSLLYLKEGGRVSTLQAMGANLLNIKPSIIVNPLKFGAMDVGPKFRGSRHKVLAKYIDQLFKNIDDIDNENLFIVHSGIDDESIVLVKEAIAEKMQFDNIYLSRAGSTISSHCGYGTVGIIFLKNK